MSAPDRDQISTFHESAQQFAFEHVAEGSSELLQWHSTSLLCNGRVRQLADQLTWAPLDQRLRLAERYFEKAALRLAAGMSAH